MVGWWCRTKWCITSKSHLTLQTCRRNGEVDQCDSGAQVRGEPRLRVSSDQQQEEVGAVVDILRAQSDECAAAGALQLAIEKRIEDRIHCLDILPRHETRVQFRRIKNERFVGVPASYGQEKRGHTANGVWHLNVNFPMSYSLPAQGEGCRT